MFFNFCNITLKIVLCFCVCFIKGKVVCLESTAVPTENENISLIAEDIRSHQFALAQDQILNLKDNNKIASIIHNVYRNREFSFFVILDFVKALTQVDLSFYVLKALRNEMVANDHRDVANMISLAKEFEDSVVFQKNNDPIIKGESVKIIEEIKVDVKNTAAEILTKAMLTNNYLGNSFVESVANEIFNFFYDLNDEIMREVVNRTYAFVPANQIVEIIMSSSNYIPQKISVFLEVFKNLEENNDLNNKVVFTIASFIKQLKTEKNYINLFLNQKYEVNEMIDKIPTCVRNLYFADEVCILNRGKWEYLYADNSKNDSVERSVFTCAPDDLKTREGSWVVEKVFDDFLLKSQSHRKQFLSLSQYKHQGINREAQTKEKIFFDDTSTNWYVEPNGDFCFLKNRKFQEYLYSSDKVLQRRERYVFGTSTRWGINPINFQWQITDCS